MGLRGYKQTEVGVLPEEWEVSSIGQICAAVVDCHHSTPVWTPFGVVVIRNQNIRDGKLDLAEPSFTDEAHYTERTRRAIPSFGDLVITREAPMGLVCMIPKRLKCCLGQRMVLLRPKQDAVVTEYLLYALLSEPIQKSISVLGGTGSTVGNLRIPTLKALEIPKPPLPEQRAIAKTLSDLDGLVTELDRLIAKKRDIRRAAMHKLLTGQTRLDGFHNEWVVRPLGEVVQIRKGQLLTSRELKHGQVPVIAGGKQPAYFHAVANRWGRTITISASGASAGYVALYDEPIFASDCSTISESPGYDLGFVYYQLLLNQDTIYRAQTGGAQPHIHAKDLNPILIPFPNTTEQAAISALLSEMDAEIRALQLRREKTVAVKQGMMQQLLAGKVRLV